MVHCIGLAALALQQLIPPINNMFSPRGWYTFWGPHRVGTRMMCVYASCLVFFYFVVPQFRLECQHLFRCRLSLLGLCVVLCRMYSRLPQPWLHWLNLRYLAGQMRRHEPRGSLPEWIAVYACNQNTFILYIIHWRNCVPGY